MAEKLTSQPPRQFQFLPLSLHLETLGGIATPLVLRGTPLPATRTQIFSTASDNQASVEIKILLGESPLAAKNHVLGKVYLMGLPNSPRGVPQIMVTFSVDQYCRVTVTGALNNSDLRVEGVIKNPQKYLTPKAIEAAITKAEADKSGDQQRVSIIEARLSADAAIERAESVLSKAQDSGSAGERARKINERLAALGLALDSGILERIHVATQELQQVLNSSPSSSFSDIFQDLFGDTLSSNPQTPRRQGTKRPIPKKGVKRPNTSTSPTIERDPARFPRRANLGKIFGGGDFALDTSLCFVLMPFAEKFQPIYEDHIQRIVTEAGLSSQRADEIASTNLITWDIWERINKARFVIADLTDRNPNVFYEVGLAHAISKDVILLTQNMGDIPFDLQSLRFIVYEYSPRGMIEFEKKLRSALAALLKAS
ncbi:MAG: Hsp70 family protein [Pyrinomonadaceae bacterium]